MSSGEKNSGNEEMEYAYFKFFDANTAIQTSVETENVSKQELLKVVEAARNTCWHKQMEYAPLNLAKVRELSSSFNVRDEKSFIEFISSLKLSSVERELKDCLEGFERKEELVADASKLADPSELALVGLLHEAFQQAFPYSLPSNNWKGSEEIRLVANTASWQVVRKTNSKNEKMEVMATCSAIFQTAMKKYCELSDPEALKEAELLLARFHPRKSLLKLREMLEAASQSKLQGDSRKYLFLKCMEQCSFPAFFSNEILSSIYPELKLPKPRGRIGKQ